MNQNLRIKPNSEPRKVQHKTKETTTLHSQDPVNARLACVFNGDFLTADGSWEWNITESIARNTGCNKDSVLLPWERESELFRVRISKIIRLVSRTASAVVAVARGIDT
jgi:hypothetical protein